ncbi:MAG: DUF2179 domain-containing protein [Acholeplasmataceae bacterium]|nr:DUF2179 domain-containing protein [Acholeplasmataceae bacterium]
MWILILELAIIFFCRIIEVSIGTVRIIMVNKGYRTQAAFLAFFEVLIWVFVASRVISGLAEQPLKGIVYSIGFACGVFVGSLLENRLAMGKVLIQAITDINTGNDVAAKLRDYGFGVTVLVGEGKDAPKNVLMIYANRKGKDIIQNKIYELDPHAVIVIQDLTSIRGGHINVLRNFVK